VLLSQFATTGLPPPHLQVWVPAIGNILNLIASLNVAIPPELVAVAGWLAGRSFEVFSKLSQHGPPVPNLIVSPLNPLVTGACYGSPPLRICPAYKNLVDDRLSEDRLRNVGTACNTPDSECGKYYEKYHKAGLVGGLMVLWCQHSICVGFHIIPTCEGRNDVFSAIYTQWPTAPKVVVYNFACQLAPYCLMREAQFFRNTRFFVDQFHASGHTKCSKASLSTYAMQFDPSLQVVNTSVAEVGNSGAAKIRKSVSSMTQRHAIQYTNIYTDVMNRCCYVFRFQKPSFHG